MNGRVTLSQVAREAGLGVATVSRALNPHGHRDVSEQTRDRVRAVADRLGYRPSLAARVLRTSQFRAVTVVVPEDSWGWWEPAVRATIEAGAAEGFHIQVQPIGSRTGGLSSVIETLANVPTEGVLFFGLAGDRAARDALGSLRLPAVSIDDSVAEVVFPTLAPDNRAGARLAVDALMAEGRRKIAVVFGGDEHYVTERMAGYAEALQDADLPPDPALKIQVASPYDEAVLRCAELDEALSGGVRLDGIFCMFDLLVPRVFRSLRAHGLRVPEDVSVIGFDDERAAQLLDPPLSSIRQPYEAMGEGALRLLLTAIAGKSVESGVTRMPVVLVQRGSTR